MKKYADALLGKWSWVAAVTAVMVAIAPSACSSSEEAAAPPPSTEVPKDASAGAADATTDAPALPHDAAVCAPSAKPYPNQPLFGTPNTRIDDYLDVLPASRGPAFDRAKGYFAAEIRGGVHWVTDGIYQSMFVVTSRGVIVVDAPPSIGANLTKAIAEVTTLPVTHLIYSHAHTDHIGAAAQFPSGIPIIAHQETERLLTRAADPNRRVPTVTFTDTYHLEDGGQSIDLYYPGNNHEPGNIIIHLPNQKVAMLVDVVFPGWMMWKRLGVAQDVPGLIPTIDKLMAIDFDTVVTGHVGRLGTRADVTEQKEFLVDLRTAAATGLGTIKLTDVIADTRPEDLENPWAVFRGYVDRSVNECVNTMASKWKNKVSGFDVWIYDQCATMEQSVRLD